MPQNPRINQRNHTIIGRSLLVIVLLVINLALLCPTSVRAEIDLESVFLPALSQRADGQYGEAALGIREIMTSHVENEAVVRRAYEHLFTTLILDHSPEAAEELASTIREALDLYPDLRPQEEYCPREIIALVQAVRLQMYGSLQITHPEGADIIVDGESQGISPLLMEFIRVGDRQLTVTKEGFKDRHETITIEPGERLSRDIELSSRNHTGWYVAGGLVAAGLIWALVGSDDGASSPLADPPPPPAVR